MMGNFNTFKLPDVFRYAS